MINIKPTPANDIHHDDTIRSEIVVIDILRQPSIGIGFARPFLSFSLKNFFFFQYNRARVKRQHYLSESEQKLIILVITCNNICMHVVGFLFL